MKDLNKIKSKKRLLRRNKIRKKIVGNSQIPRLSVYKSLSNIYAQLIDDTKGSTMVFIDDRKINKGTKTEKAYEVGLMIAKAAKDKNISQIVFDRGGFKYHGRLKALAEGAREGGLKF